MSINPDTEHLLGCPWCGRAPSATETSWEDDGSNHCAIECLNDQCPASNMFVCAPTRNAAEKLWNDQPGLARLRAERDEARVTADAERAAHVNAEVRRCDALNYAAEIAQGVSHYPHGDDEPCVRCERDRLRDALRDISEDDPDDGCRQGHAKFASQSLARGKREAF